GIIRRRNLRIGHKPPIGILLRKVVLRGQPIINLRRLRARPPQRSRNASRPRRRRTQKILLPIHKILIRPLAHRQYRQHLICHIRPIPIHHRQIRQRLVNMNLSNRRHLRSSLQTQIGNDSSRHRPSSPPSKTPRSDFPSPFCLAQGSICSPFSLAGRRAGGEGGLHPTPYTLIEDLSPNVHHRLYQHIHQHARRVRRARKRDPHQLPHQRPRSRRHRLHLTAGIGNRQIIPRRNRRRPVRLHLRNARHLHRDLARRRVRRYSLHRHAHKLRRQRPTRQRHIPRVRPRHYHAHIRAVHAAVRRKRLNQQRCLLRHPLSPYNPTE